MGRVHYKFNVFILFELAAAATAVATAAVRVVETTAAARAAARAAAARAERRLQPPILSSVSIDGTRPANTGLEQYRSGARRDGGGGGDGGGGNRAGDITKRGLSADRQGEMSEVFRGHSDVCACTQNWQNGCFRVRTQSTV